MDMQLEGTPLAFFRAKSVRSLWLLIACVYVNACMQRSIYLDRCSLPQCTIFSIRNGGVYYTALSSGYIHDILLASCKYPIGLQQCY